MVRKKIKNINRKIFNQDINLITSTMYKIIIILTFWGIYTSIVYKVPMNITTSFIATRGLMHRH